MPADKPKGSGNQVAEDLLRQRGIQYTVEYSVSPETIARPDEGTQVRNPEHQAPTANVKKYAAAMLSGAKFPAVIVDVDGNLLDGNTRHAAALKSGRALNIIRIKDTLGILDAKLLQMALNNAHGEQLTKQETKSTIANIVLAGKTIDPGSVAVQAGYPKEMVKRWIAASELQLRTRTLGIDLPALNESQKVQVQKLVPDALLEGLLELVSDAKLQSTEITPLVKDLNAAAEESTEAADKKLREARNAHSARIHQFGTGLVASPWSNHVKHLRALEDHLKADDARKIHDSDLPGALSTVEGLIAVLKDARDIIAERIADQDDVEELAS